MYRRACKSKNSAVFWAGLLHLHKHVWKSCSSFNHQCTIFSCVFQGHALSSAVLLHLTQTVHQHTSAGMHSEAQGAEIRAISIYKDKLHTDVCIMVQKKVY